jgi:hypothetical protein
MQWRSFYLESNLVPHLTTRPILHGFEYGLYAKREVRGQNFDVVAISKNLKACESANPYIDLIFRYDANPLAVSKSGETLIVFWAGTYEPPKQPIPNVIVNQANPSFSSKVRNPDRGDVQSIDIPLEYSRHGAGECLRD